MRRLFVALQRLLPDRGGALGGVLGAGDLPAFVGAPVGQQRPVERRLVALQRMRGAEEMAAGRDLGDGVERDILGRDGERLDGLRHHLQHLDIEHDLLERSGQPALHPAGAMIDEVGGAITEDQIDICDS